MTIAQTIFENADRKRVWVYWFNSRPEFVPGYWDIEDNTEAREWCEKMNAWVIAMQEIGCSYENIETTIRYTMVDALGFDIIEDYQKYEIA